MKRRLGSVLAAIGVTACAGEPGGMEPGRVAVTSAADPLCPAPVEVAVDADIVVSWGERPEDTATHTPITLWQLVHIPEPAEVALADCATLVPTDDPEVTVEMGHVVAPPLTLPASSISHVGHVDELIVHGDVNAAILLVPTEGSSVTTVNL